MSPLIAFEPIRLIAYALYGLAAVLTLAVLPKIPGMQSRIRGSEEIVEEERSPIGPLAGGHLLVIDDEDEEVDQAATLHGGVYVCYRLDAFHAHADRAHVASTTNLVLQRTTDRVKSVDQVMADSYAPILPPSAVMPLDQRKEPTVIQRFGDIRTLITHTVDPLLGEYFRDFEM